jgi:hypothetical protein
MSHARRFWWLPSAWLNPFSFAGRMRISAKQYRIVHHSLDHANSLHQIVFELTFGLTEHPDAGCLTHATRTGRESSSRFLTEDYMIVIGAGMLDREKEIV